MCVWKESGNSMDYSWTDIADLRAKLIAMLEEEHTGLVTDLRLSIEGDTLVLAGEVASEGCRGGAKRFALAFDGVFKVRNELIVAAYLEAASDPDLDGFFEGKDSRGQGLEGVKRVDWSKRTGRGQPTAELKEPETPTSVEVVRYPSIEAAGDLIPDQLVAVSLDLTVAPQPGSEPVSLGRFPPDWDSIAITVQLIAPWASETVAETSTITIKADGTSQPARFECRVSADYIAGTPAQIHAVFLHGTRICGHAMRDLAAAPGEALPNPVAAAPATPQAARAGFRVMPDAAGPSVSISIIRGADRTQSWLWRAIVPGGVIEGTGGVTLGDEDKAFADGLLETCPGLAPERFERTLDGIGERLWDAAPEGFRAAYAGWRAKLGIPFPIQFATDDPYVPWEMMKPRLEGARHLYLDHPVARWPLSRSNLRRHQFAGGDVLSFVPRYAKHKALKFAIVEGEWICSALGGRAMAADINTFLDVLDGKVPGPVGLVHFAGHGREHTGVSSGGIELEDGVVSLTDVHQDRVVLGKRDGTLIVLNACETAAGARLLGMNSGWGGAIADREFGGLIAPLWEVQDEIALAMMQSALPPLLGGTQTLGEAVTAARLANSGTSVAAFAYLAHGDVMAKFAG